MSAPSTPVAVDLDADTWRMVKEDEEQAVADLIAGFMKNKLSAL